MWSHLRKCCKSSFFWAQRPLKTLRFSLRSHWWTFVSTLMFFPHRPQLTHNSVGGTYLHIFRLTRMCKHTQYGHTRKMTVGGTDETHNSVLLWEGLCCWIQTVGLVWLCDKARLFSRSCRHRDQARQTQPLTSVKIPTESFCFTRSCRMVVLNREKKIHNP